MIRKLAEKKRGMVSDRFKYMDCLVKSCSKSECGSEMDKFEVGALVLVLTIGSVGNQKWLYHGTRCMSCVFDGNLETRKFSRTFLRALETYAEKINHIGAASKLAVNQDPLDDEFDKYSGDNLKYHPSDIYDSGDYMKNHPSGLYDADIEDLYQTVSR